MRGPVPDSAGVVGGAPSIAIGPAGTVHSSYLEIPGGRVKYVALCPTP